MKRVAVDTAAMYKTLADSQKGFTLIEIISIILLMGILAASAQFPVRTAAAGQKSIPVLGGQS